MKLGPEGWGKCHVCENRDLILPRGVSVSSMANVKTVVVQLRDLNRLIQLQPSDNDARTEREVLISRIRDEFGTRIASDDCVILQVQSNIEKFKGLFLDYFDDSIEDGSIFKVVLEKKEVCYRQQNGMGRCVNFLKSLGG